jgi:DNA-binding MarR family transcriptional regulator
MNQISLQRDFDIRQAAVTNDLQQIEPTITSLGSRYAQLNTIRAALKARRQRSDFFSAKLFADPAWDMILELYAASLTERRLSVSRLAERSGVPMTTALRWIATLEAEGLIERQEDPFDKRRYFLLLSDNGANAMKSFFDQLQPGTRLL